MLTTLRLSRRHHGHPRHLRSFHRFVALALRPLRLPPLHTLPHFWGGLAVADVNGRARYTLHIYYGPAVIRSGGGVAMGRRWFDSAALRHLVSRG